MVVDSSSWAGDVANDAGCNFGFVDRYQPCFEIEAGGMATVYLARTTNGGGAHRFVALKRIHPHLVGDRNFREMFLDEAQLLSRIVHPNVCSVFDFEAHGDTYYIAMEYLMGESLARVRSALVKRGKPTGPRESCFIARVIADACEGLHAAHELRDGDGELLHVIHRDVSPQNLFVTYDGAVKVVDFGLVRADRRKHKTKTGMVKGKFAYVAPEAIAMKRLDRRVDVWGLGVVLWEMLTHKRLFQRDNEMDTLLAVSTAEIKPPSKVRRGVPPALDAIVMRALARDPDQRYPTTRELGRDLMRFLHGAPDPTGMSDLAAWMEQLFPTGRERKQQLLEIASQLERTTVPPRAPELGRDSWTPRGRRSSASWRTSSSLTQRRSMPPRPSWPSQRAIPGFGSGAVLTPEESLYAAATRIIPGPPAPASTWLTLRGALRKHGLTTAAVTLSCILAVALATARSSHAEPPSAAGMAPVVLQAAPEYSGPTQGGSDGASCASEPPLGTYVLELPENVETGSRRLVVQLRPANRDAIR